MLRELLWPEDGFKPVSRGALIGWGVFYLLFFLNAAVDEDGFLFLDHANLIIHEGGHFFFSWLGSYYFTILGGTLGELIVPLLCGLYFFRRGETTAVAFCGFWFFENFLYIGTYMSDARTAALPLVGSEESDWTILFTHWGLLIHDRVIGGWARFLGWLGMFASVAWLAWMHLRTREEAGESG